jgi:N-methylhydantoinase A
MKIATDTGGTFTDLIIENDDGRLEMYKASTTPDDPILGVIDALTLAANAKNLKLEELMSQAQLFIHGTTHAINAIITENTARTALITTLGHRDILFLREGGRSEPFNHSIPFPRPYIPRHLTFEAPERINSAGEVVLELDERIVIDIIAKLREEKIESVAVCLLWSILNPKHESRIAELLQEHLPNIPFSLSHNLNPSLREFRRACSTSIDASLKPLMTRYLSNLKTRLAVTGFKGRVLVCTSQGGMMDGGSLAESPIHAINSGPAMAPISGKYYADDDSEFVIVADTGGTTYDISLVRRGEIPWTRDTWLGEPFRGHMTGFPSVDVRSVGSGGGSIAWVDSGGLLHVGPQSAGADPGPVCYQRGGKEPTVTDAALVLGYVDPDFFLGGTMVLDLDAAKKAIQEKISRPLGISCEDSAINILRLTTENMVQAINDITINQGIDPRLATLIGGGGAAGLNSSQISKRLGCKELIIPEVGATLSASGALLSPLRSEYRHTFYTTSIKFNHTGVNEALDHLEEQCVNFKRAYTHRDTKTNIQFAVEARYEGQVWELEIPFGRNTLNDADKKAEMLVEKFHHHHEEVFGMSDQESSIEFIGWSAKVTCHIASEKLGKVNHLTDTSFTKKELVVSERETFFTETGWILTKIYPIDSLEIGERHEGPAIIESPFTTIVVEPESTFKIDDHGSIRIQHTS